VYGEHTGENLGSVVLELLKEYDIGGDEIGYFMLDNASSNDTAVGFILKELCLWMDSNNVAIADFAVWATLLTSAARRFSWVGTVRSI
jgi:hypothetical protein